jgi:hypothetical protein
MRLVFLYAVYFVEGIAAPYFRFLPAVPLLLPLAAVGFAMFRGSTQGAALGLFAGALLDVSLDRPVLLFMLTTTALCMLIGALCETVVARSLPAYLVISLAVLLLYAFMQMFPLLFFERVPPRALLMTGVRQTAASLPFALLFYPLLRRRR